ncbi:MAG: VanZ family protein [Planctomycetota bacterium]|nr:VanZ family protein [Planctomycetota bacterium]
MRRKLTVMTLAVYWLVLFIGTHVQIPSEVNQVLQEGNDKLIHAGMYALLAILWGTWRSTLTTWTWRETVHGIIILALYGMADELLQIPVGRNGDFADWLADCFGLCTGFIICGSIFAVLPRLARSRPSASA